jgi:cyclic beta-1,2-glucan synthetase
MGTGDWNDGMNRVGAGGKGESVWVGWFLLSCLERFREHAQRRGDTVRVDAWRSAVEGLKKAIEEQAWDGGWYRRAWFDDGTPLGSAVNPECRIDSIAQSWAVISGAGDPVRAAEAMAEVQKQLVRDKDGLILLFTPPFDKSDLHPGYIKGYVPGIRENGGQYTHAAIWAFLATAMLGQGRRAGELLDMLNPIRRSATPEGVANYRVEPYVVAADIYGVVPHVGRGGWTWYTGSASWLYRAVLETLLGFHLEGTSLRLTPCIPPTWEGFVITYRHRSSIYQIRVDNSGHVENGCSEVLLDGAALADKVVPLVDDGRKHEVIVKMG